jgi:hypothetical protein
MLSTPTFTLPELSKWHRTKMLHHATKVLEAQQKMTGKKGKNILHYTLKKKRRHLHMDHYPKGDRIDFATGSQYFYHCHRENFESYEHGHFHCFMRYKNIPKSIKPVYPKDVANHEYPPMTHLVAIAMNQFGQPIRLFTVNQWISSEIWYEAKQCSKFVKRFNMTLTDDPYWQILDQWVTGMLHLFTPQIAWLHIARDQAMALRKQNSPDENVFEDRSLEEVSEIPVDLTSQINWIIGS